MRSDGIIGYYRHFRKGTEVPPLFPSQGYVVHVFLTRSPLTHRSVSFTIRPFDLHALATPPAFVLSQDQTLQLLFVSLSSATRKPRTLEYDIQGSQSGARENENHRRRYTPAHLRPETRPHIGAESPGHQAPTLPQHAAARSFTFSRRQTCSLVKEHLAAPNLEYRAASSKAYHTHGPCQAE